MAKVKMAVVPSKQRSVQGPNSHTIYNFNPWCLVEEKDVVDMQRIKVSKGCACNGTQKVYPLFATEEQILSGQVVPEWYKPNGKN